ncbi:MAG: hypothetical protein L6R39_007494 [Caloplaca ligustica]|nr:MAG: hypothetical protein L6R39_007494 [Caloplaca ligustica]
MASSAVQWQIDLPGFSSLILNMGAAGLKKIAQAGVDIHTLLCMGEIAEVCLACLDYRKEINTCRQQQRKNSVWLYKMIEIGTASNFLADELLKKRAGENILALMSTILPLLAEEDSDAFILRLFEAYKVDLDKTPGLGQLQAFRDAILPLTQKLAFKDRMYQYHILLDRLRDSASRHLCTSVPNVETLVQVVMMFQRLVFEHEPRYSITYRGWEGAAWVITYARHVLGLPVCVLQSQQDTVPINGRYQDSRVYVYLSEQENRCELVANGHIPDLVIPTDAIGRTVGTIDIANVSLRHLYFSSHPVPIGAITTIIMSWALMFTAQRAHLLGVRATDRLLSDTETGVTPYTVFCLPHLYRRALRIIDAMGFCAGLDVEPDSDAWEEYFEVTEYLGHHSRPSYLLKPGRKWVDCSLPCHIGQTDCLFDGDGQGLVRRMFLLADAASYLAFSNWGEEIRILSTRYLENGLPTDYATMSFKEDTESGRLTGTCFTLLDIKESYGLHSLTRALAFIVTGEIVDSHKNTIALEYRSIVLARAAASQNSIALDALLIHFYSGQITMLGQRRAEIRSRGSFDTECHYRMVIPPAFNTNVIKIAPSNAFPELAFKSIARLGRASIEVTQSLIVADKLYPYHCPTFSNEGILSYHVTQDCAHPYSTPASITWLWEMVQKPIFYGRGSSSMVGLQERFGDPNCSIRVPLRFTSLWGILMGGLGLWCQVFVPYLSTRAIAPEYVRT